MCERCKDSWATATPLRKTRKGVDCDLCEVSVSGSARYSVSEFSFQRHLCEPHMKRMRRDLAGGLAEIWKQVGLQEATEFMPIKKAAICEVETPSLATKRKKKNCRKRARYAEFGLVKMPMCREHAKFSGCAV